MTNIEVVFDPQVGGVVPTGAKTYQYHAGPSAGNYYSPVKQFWLTIRDPGNGGTPYIQNLYEFAVQSDPNQNTTVLRNSGWDANGNVTTGADSSAWPEFSISNYSLSWDGGGFGPGYTASGGGGGTPEAGTTSTLGEEILRKSTQSTDGLLLQNGEFYVLQ